MKLVPNAKKGWKWISVQMMALNTALLATWIGLPDDLKSRIPEQWVFWAATSIAVIGIVGRFIDQGGSDA